MVHKEKQTTGADASNPGTVNVLSLFVTAHPAGTFSHAPDQSLFIGPLANLYVSSDPGVAGSVIVQISSPSKSAINWPGGLPPKFPPAKYTPSELVISSAILTENVILTGSETSSQATQKP